ncbi:MAG: hypothetical protein UT81_C0006G0002 [Parcubacteria group bacterium GW2011_GWA2_40_14]|nr:MAG: hypothetical protein UT81_C0006G0002 [Parcubacteria group bacterium GW2011_GWA2_40_14]
MIYTQKNNGQKGYGTSAQRYGNFGTGKFTPRKPVRSFRDLEVYQKTMECAVLIIKNLRPTLVKLKYDFLENMTNCAMSVPLYIGEAHSLRFQSFEGGVMLFEKSMAGFSFGKVVEKVPRCRYCGVF